MRIDTDRWDLAQTTEFGHHQDLSREAYSYASERIAHYLEIDYKNIYPKFLYLFLNIKISFYLKMNYLRTLIITFTSLSH